MRTAVRVLRCAACQSHILGLPGWTPVTPSGTLPAAHFVDVPAGEQGSGQPPVPGPSPDKVTCAAAGPDREGLDWSHRGSALVCVRGNNSGCCSCFCGGCSGAGNTSTSTSSLTPLTRQRLFSSSSSNRDWVIVAGIVSAKAAATAPAPAAWPSSWPLPSAMQPGSVPASEGITPRPIEQRHHHHHPHHRQLEQPESPGTPEQQIQPTGAAAAGFTVVAAPPPQRPTAAELLSPMLEGKPFTMAQVPGRGRGLVASRPIPRGEMVHRESPLLTFPELRASLGVCYHCLGPLAMSSSPVRHPGANGRRFCCDTCLEAALGQYLAVEEAAAVAAAADAGGDEGGRGGSLARLYEQCQQHGERFPLMAARLAFMEVSEAIRQCLGGKRRKRSLVSERRRYHGRHDTEGDSVAPAEPFPVAASSEAAAASATNTNATTTTTDSATTTIAAAAVAIANAGTDTVATAKSDANTAPESSATADTALVARGGDPLCSLHVLCFANVSPPYPPHWLEQHGLLTAALRNLAADLEALQNLGRHQQRQQGAEELRTLRESSAPLCGADERAPEASMDLGVDVGVLLSRVVTAVVAERLGVEWFVEVMARLHLNVFQVHNPLAGADPADLAAAASALVSGTAGGASSGSAAYLLASLFNHSCDPTLELAFPNLDATAAFVAARDIAPGEELCVSYLDVGLPYNVRRQHLEWSYGFMCGCARCQEEAAEAEARTGGERDV